MRNRHGLVMAVVALALVSALTQAAESATAQQQVRANMGAFRARENQLIEAAEKLSTPRMADGRIDLTGTFPTDFYMAGTQANRAGGNIILISPEYGRGGRQPMPADGPKYKPEHLAKVDFNDINQPKVDGTFHCGWPGTPRIGSPQQIFQTPREVVFLYKDYSGMVWRVIPTDGRKHRDVDPTYFGDSVGKWEGDTLVIDSVNFVEDTWFGERGYFHSDKMRVTERITRKGDVLYWEARVEDPEVLAAPYLIKQRKFRKAAEGTLLEEPPRCVENDFKDMVNMDNHGQR